MELVVNKARLQLVQGDITEQDTDAIVNAANSTLMGGGGVDGAIHHAGGPAILEECKAIRAAMGSTLPAGKAVITTGGKLKARWVIHTVGPVWRGGGDGEPGLLSSAYRNSLKLAVDRGLKTVAFPSISTGAYGYPMAEAAGVAVRAIIDFLNERAGLDEVRLVLRDTIALETYSRALRSLQPSA